MEIPFDLDAWHYIHNKPKRKYKEFESLFYEFDKSYKMALKEMKIKDKDELINTYVYRSNASARLRPVVVAKQRVFNYFLKIYMEEVLNHILEGGKWIVFNNKGMYFNIFVSWVRKPNYVFYKYNPKTEGRIYRLYTWQSSKFREHIDNKYRYMAYMAGNFAYKLRKQVDKGYKYHK